MTTKPATQTPPRPLAGIHRIAAAVDPHPESRDAARLGAAIAAATGADLMMIAVEPELPLLIPGADWRRMRRETDAMLAHIRSECAPGARTAIDTDLSIPRGIQRVVRNEHRQLLVVGSSRKGQDGLVSIGGRTRQLLDDLTCSLAIAVRGLSAEPKFQLRRIGVGFDGGAESKAALATAATIAAGCGAELVVRGAVDERIPALGWPSVWLGELKGMWQEVMDEEAKSLHETIDAAAAELPIPVTVDIQHDRASVSLRQLSAEVDLLVIGSRRWGAVARVLLGGAGEALVHGGRCSLLVVPRPEDG